jgi:hypothetical protein
MPNGAPVKNSTAARENHKKDTLTNQLSLAIRPGNASLSKHRKDSLYVLKGILVNYMLRDLDASNQG